MFEAVQLWPVSPSPKENNPMATRQGGPGVLQSCNLEPGVESGSQCPYLLPGQALPASGLHPSITLLVLCTAAGFYRKGDRVDIKETGTVQKGLPCTRDHGKTGRVYGDTQQAVGIVVNEQGKGKTLAKRINVCMAHSKHRKGQDSFLKCVKENEGSQR
ncbi:hypothetical protein MC885_016697 [Smutsia gigantea]|nr:hypothetical protein MC885_016697 [Smutsia gigantea]